MLREEIGATVWSFWVVLDGDSRRLLLDVDSDSRLQTLHWPGDSLPPELSFAEDAIGRRLTRTQGSWTPTQVKGTT